MNIYYNEILSDTFPFYCTILEQAKVSYQEHNLAEIILNFLSSCMQLSLSFKLPAVVNKYSLTPLSLVAFFHRRNILVKSFIMLINDISKFACKHTQVTAMEMQFE